MGEVQTQPTVSAVVVQRTIIAVLLLGFVESVLVYQTGRLPVQFLPEIFAPHVLMGVGFLGLAALFGILGRLYGRSNLAGGPITASLLLILGPVFLFAARGGGHVPAANLPFAWLRWGITVGLFAANLAYASRRRFRAEDWPDGGFFSLALFSYSLAAIGLALRTIDWRGWTSSGFMHCIAGTAVAIGFVAIAGPLILRGGDTRWRRLFGVVLAVLAVAGATTLRKARALPSPRPQGHLIATSSTIPLVRGIIVITLDTVRRDHVSVYGSQWETTPHLKRLADVSTVFDNAYASAPYTLSSHASLFTGLLPHDHGAHADPERLRGDLPLAPATRTLAEVLGASGYRTVGIAANFGYLAPWTGLSRGFQEYVATEQHYFGYYPMSVPLRSRIQRTHDPYNDYWPADAVTSAGIQWLEKNGSRPFFLFLNYLDAHEYQRSLPRAAAPTLVDSDMSSRSLILAAYDERIHFEDAEVGRLLDWLSRNELFDRTLIVVTSDHGEYFGEHNFWSHGQDLHEPVLQVPLLVKFPNSKRAARINVRINHGQMFSLVKSIASGVDQKAALAQLSIPEPRVIAELWNWKDRRRRWPKFFGWRASRAIYDGAWKMIERTNGASELYDLGADPNEAHDLFRTQPDLAKARAATLIAHLPPLDGRPSPGSASEPPSSEATESLRALGYIGP